MKRIYLISKSLIVLVMLASLTFAGCKKGWWGYDEGNNGGGNGGGSGNDFVQGTIIKFDCGKSFYGNDYWIKTDAGLLLQPCAQSFQTFCGIILNEGDRVEIKYSPYKGSTQGYEITCKANIRFERVTIDYINVIGYTKTCKPVEIPDVYENLTSGVNINSARISGNSLVLNIGYSGCDNSTERFLLVAKLLPTAGAVPTYEIKIADMNVQECKMNMTNEVCFDLSKLRNPLSSSYINLNLVGYDKIIEFL